MITLARRPDADPTAVAALIARIFPQGHCRFERTATGVSTLVYRVWRDDAVFYLRLAEEREDSLAPEVFVHTLLRERAVKVPEVVHFEPFDEGLQRSVMLTTEIPGEPLAAYPTGSGTAEILRDAGRDLAIINSLPVMGFGWIKRDAHEVGGLEADHPSQREFIFEHLEGDLELLGAGTLTAEEIAAFRGILERFDATLDVQDARLAHGDVDVTHIYEEGGHYSGIIDFGEIRGADRLYDLAHFALHDGEVLPRLPSAELLAGYREAAALPADFARRIRLLSLLIGTRALAHGLGRPHAVFLALRVRELIAGCG